jgi:hypothetical protein
MDIRCLPMTKNGQRGDRIFGKLRKSGREVGLRTRLTGQAVRSVTCSANDWVRADAEMEDNI